MLTSPGEQETCVSVRGRRRRVRRRPGLGKRPSMCRGDGGERLLPGGGCEGPGTWPDTSQRPSLWGPSPAFPAGHSRVLLLLQHEVGNPRQARGRHVLSVSSSGEPSGPWRSPAPSTAWQHCPRAPGPARGPRLRHGAGPLPSAPPGRPWAPLPDGWQSFLPWLPSLGPRSSPSGLPPEPRAAQGTDTAFRGGRT